MFELRVLNGLHQGTALPLIGEQWSVGASEEDDLALFEPDLSAAALTVKRLESQWLVNGAEYQDLVFEAQTPLRLGHVWLMISHTTAPWTPFELAEDNGAEQHQLGQTSPRASRGSKLGIGLLGTVVATVSTLALGLPDTAEVAPVVPSHTPLAITDAQMSKDILLHMLKARDLAGVDVLITEHKIVLGGALVTEEELQRLARMVERFERKYRSALPLVNDVRQRQFKLPFRIVQVATGPMAHLVTHNGNRLFVGDEIEGIRLLAIADNRISFGGKFQLELAW